MLPLARLLTGALTLVIALAPLGASHAGMAAIADPLTWTTLVDDQSYGFARAYPSIVFDARRARVIALCGRTTTACFHSFGSKYFTDVRVLDPSAGTPWDTIAIGAGGRPERHAAAAVYDSAGDRILLFGGVHEYGGSTSFPPPPPSLFNDLWSLDLSTSTWSMVPATGVAPAKRLGASLTLDPVRNRVILFGGADSAGIPLSDVWQMPLSSLGAWTPLATTGTPPAGRLLHLAAYDPGAERLLLTGGWSAPGTLSSGTWALSLAGTPAWTQIAAPGIGPVGPAIGGIDSRRGRLLVVSGESNLTVRVLDLSSDQWSTAAPGGDSPVGFLFMNPVFAAGAAVIDPVHDLLAFSWSGPSGGGCGYEAMGYTHALRFGALPTVTLSAALGSVTYFRGVASVHWNFALDRVPWSPIDFQSDAAGSFARFARSSAMSSGPAVGSLPATASTLYHFRMRWFDGTTSQATAPVAVQTPPPPVNVAVTKESLFVSGGFLFPRFILANDSLWMLTPSTLYHRVNGGAWSALTTTYPELDGRLWEREDDVPPNTLYEYRLGWGPDSTHFSPIFALMTPPTPVFDSSHVEAHRITIWWHSIPGANLQGRIKKSAPGGEGWPDVFSVQTDAEGRIVFEDFLVAASTYYNYQLTWFEGGVERVSTDIGLATLPESGFSPANSNQLALSSPYPNPATQSFSVSVDVPAGSEGTIELVDVAGRRRWSRALAAGRQFVRIDLRGIESGIYGLSVRQGDTRRSRRIAIVQ